MYNNRIMIKLPDEFLNKMKALMGEEEYEKFILSYNMPRYHGLRVNTLKTTVDNFLQISDFKLEPIPWTRDGFYYDSEDNPGKHPYYYSGLYYIQEPSAMFPATVLDAKPGEYVLDLCAAPGGKTAQIAASMQGRGLLVSNDTNSERTKALVKNIELCGIKNAIVTNEQPQKLALKFGKFFDKILVDAPCSGEGMFRKDWEAIKSWGKYKCENCALIQKEILDQADKMLKPGGRIVYSTCTFSPEENEMVIHDFLEKHDNYDVIEIPLPEGAERGRPEWAGADSRVAGAVRFWPHRVKGEGHFITALEKIGHDAFNQATDEYESRQEPVNYSKNYNHRNNRDNDYEQYMKLFREFERNNLNIEIDGNFTLIGRNLYYLPVPLPDLNGVKTVKFGWYLGNFSKGHFEPSHSMVMALGRDDIKNTVNFSASSPEIIKYLKGETLLLEGEKGYTGVCVDGFTVGWAKQTGNMLKNMYPAGWRMIRE